MSEDAPKVCAVCRKVLDRFSWSDGQEQWAHASQVYRDAEDHLPIPIDPTEDNVSANCDFCYAEMGEDQWTVVSRPFHIDAGFDPDTGEHVTSSMSALWAACPTCKPMIENRRWDALLDYVMECAEKQYPATNFLEKLARRKYVGDLYQKLALHYVKVRRAQGNELATDNDFVPEPWKKK